jgi:hypothetical protein
MHYRYEPWLLDLMRSDSEFLRKMGIKACVIDDPAPKPSLEEVIRQCEMTHVRAKERLTKADRKWLKAMAVAWEREPAVQLSLDLCGCEENVQQT